MYLIIVGNMKFFERILLVKENTIYISIIEQMCIVFDMKFNQMQDKLEKYSSFISELIISKNILWNIKAVFLNLNLGLIKMNILHS